MKKLKMVVLLINIWILMVTILNLFLGTNCYRWISVVVSENLPFSFVEKEILRSVVSLNYSQRTYVDI